MLMTYVLVFGLSSEMVAAECVALLLGWLVLSQA